MRVVHCDFCYVPLTDHGWHCPARDFDYDAPRYNPDMPNVPVEGSIGAWLACDKCAEDVRNGNRDRLVKRAVYAAYGVPMTGTEALKDLRDLHDAFWENREGEPVAIDAEQIALIARDPPTRREFRPW